MSMQAAALVVLAAATFIPGSNAGPLLLEALPELSKEDVTPRPKHQSRKVLSAEPGAPAVSLEGAKFIPFKWGVEEITEPEWDSFKYEQEISALLDSPLSDWAVIPEEVVGSSDFTVALRPIDVDGQPPTQVVAYFEATFKSPGARAFFDFWVTVEGRTTITAPSALLEAESREAGIKSVGPMGATVFSTAQSTFFSPTQSPIALTSTHWQTCGPSELTYMSYPAEVPMEFRIPEVQALAGNPENQEFVIVFAERVRQIDEDTIKVNSVQWGDLLPEVLLPYPEPISWAVPINLYTGLYGRLAAHFEQVEYPPPTGDECTDMKGRPGKGHGGKGRGGKGTGGKGRGGKGRAGKGRGGKGYGAKGRGGKGKH